jgi:hypothetical protein
MDWFNRTQAVAQQYVKQTIIPKNNIAGVDSE